MSDAVQRYEQTMPSRDWFFVVRVRSEFDPEADYVRATLEGHTDGLLSCEDVEVKAAPEDTDAIHFVAFKTDADR